MRKYFIICLTVFFMGNVAISQNAKQPRKIKTMGDAKSPILSAIAVPAGKSYFYTSGLVPSMADSTAQVGSRERFGDTKTQAISTLKNIEEVLKKEGLKLTDVIYLRAYVAADKFKENKPDFAGWMEAYGVFYNNTKNPNKVARSTVGVLSLVNPDWLIEVEAVAVYP